MACVYFLNSIRGVFFPPNGGVNFEENSVAPCNSNLCQWQEKCRKNIILSFFLVMSVGDVQDGKGILFSGDTL